MELKAKVREFIASGAISMNELGRSLGYSNGSMISQWLGETAEKPFKGDRAKLASAVEAYVVNYERNHSSRTIKTQEWIETNDYKMAKYVVDQAVIEREMALLCGDPGVGKTTAIKRIAASLPQAIVIEADISMTAKALFRALCLQLGVDTPPRNLYEMKEVVIDRLKKRDCVIFIDEGEHLPHRALEMLRRVWDFTKTPIVYCGTRILLNNITGASRGAEYAQLKRRIKGKWEFRSLVYEEMSDDDKPRKSDKELRKVCAVFGVESEKVIGAVYRVAGGNFGNVIDLLKNSAKLAALHDAPISAQIVEEAARMLLI
ncbi:MAG: AAA family ATPase [Helicobacteraceae bacterium]|jgi:DNA transposition AAA+ family ATPase|nr:AAA family ATPase [Helicobacteraceae bacterium]